MSRRTLHYCPCFLDVAQAAVLTLTYKPMRPLILFLHTSLDGYVAGPNGEMDWIHIDDEIFDYADALTDQADIALYGRVTYEMMENYWPTAGALPDAGKHEIHHSRWYNSVPKVVVSNSLKGHDIPNTRIIGGDLAGPVQALKQQPGKSIVIFGSPGAAHSLMQHNLIDEYRLFANPVLLGAGIPVFRNISHRVGLKLVEAKVFASGVVGLHYTLS